MRSKLPAAGRFKGMVGEVLLAIRKSGMKVETADRRSPAYVTAAAPSAARRKNGTHFRWCHAVRGLPVLVQRNGLARVLLK